MDPKDYSISSRLSLQTLKRFLIDPPPFDPLNTFQTFICHTLEQAIHSSQSSLRRSNRPIFWEISEDPIVQCKLKEEDETEELQEIENLLFEKKVLFFY